MKSNLVKLLLAAFVLASAHPTLSATLSPTDLRCDYAVNPLGVDSSNPRLFWKVASRERGQRQIAYQILVASSGKNLAKNNGDLWDSGKVASDETIQIYYAGAALKSSQQVFWKVRMWDANGKASAWSKPATWTMGLLSDSDWNNSSWIAASDTNLATIVLRREFVVKPGLKRALANVCGLGQYELSLNGKKAGDDFLSSGWTKYDKTCLYDTRDITAQIQPGTTNAIGLILGNSFYNVTPGYWRYVKTDFNQNLPFGPLRAIAQIELDYTNGTTQIIGSDANWLSGPGAISFENVYAGEDYDARLEPAGWNQPGYANAEWTPAVLTNGPGGILKGSSCAAPPIGKFDVFTPVATNVI